MLFDVETYIHIGIRGTKVDTCRIVIHTNRCKRTNEIKNIDNVYT